VVEFLPRKHKTLNSNLVTTRPSPPKKVEVNGILKTFKNYMHCYSWCYTKGNDGIIVSDTMTTCRKCMEVRSHSFITCIDLIILKSECINGKMRPVETIPGMGGGESKGEWWRGCTQV
jgi:hypothetical protein